MPCIFWPPFLLQRSYRFRSVDFDGIEEFESGALRGFQIRPSSWYGYRSIRVVRILTFHETETTHSVSHSFSRFCNLGPLDRVMIMIVEATAYIRCLEGMMEIFDGQEEVLVIPFLQGRQVSCSGMGQAQRIKLRKCSAQLYMVQSLMAMQIRCT